MGAIEELDDWYDPDSEYEQPVSCKYCDDGPFYWDEMPDGRKRLFDEEGNLHVCIEYSGGDSRRKV